MISIIIPNFNNPQLLSQCLASLAQVEQDKTRYETIVVDDGSTEESLTAIRALCSQYKAKLIEHGENKYFSAAINTGAAAADPTSTAYVLINSDIVFISPFIDTLETKFKMNQHIGIIGAVLLYPDKTIQHAGVGLTPAGWFGHAGLGTQYKASTVLGAYFLGVTGAFMAIRRSGWDIIGEYDTSYVGAYEDIEYCLRAWENGISVWLESSILAYHLEGKTRGVSQQEKMSVSPYLWMREQVTIKILKKRIEQPGYLPRISQLVTEARTRIR